MEPSATELTPANPESDILRLAQAGAPLVVPLHPSPSSHPDYVYPSKRRTMASSALFTPSSDRPRFKTVLWISLGLTALFVLITSEVLLVTDYPMYHAYRLQVIADRN